MSFSLIMLGMVTVIFILYVYNEWKNKKRKQEEAEA